MSYAGVARTQLVTSVPAQGPFPIHCLLQLAIPCGRAIFSVLNLCHIVFFSLLPAACLFMLGFCMQITLYGLLHSLPRSLAAFMWLFQRKLPIVLQPEFSWLVKRYHPLGTPTMVASVTWMSWLPLRNGRGRAVGWLHEAHIYPTYGKPWSKAQQLSNAENNSPKQALLMSCK